MTAQSDAEGLVRTLKVGDRQFDYYSLEAAQRQGFGAVQSLPYTVRVLLENLIRNQAAGRASDLDARAIVARLLGGEVDVELEFHPVRVMMPESSGITLMGDMAAMRDAMVALGGDPARINPTVPVDFIVDHSVMVEDSGKPTSLQFNMDSEFAQNLERYEFLRWCGQAFDGLRVFPPGSGICHQINLEFLARVVSVEQQGGRSVACPDSLIGMDSHTAMVNSLGVVAWGVGGFEGGNAALGEPVIVSIPEVVGVRLVGKLPAGTTSTDLVLTITQRLRREQVIGRFVEYFGPGVDSLSLTERATVSNMTPEYGATMAFFPVDAQTLRFLELTGRDASHLALVKAYCQAQGLWRDADSAEPRYARVVEIDLGAVVPSVAGPSRPDARVALSEAPAAFARAVAKPPQTVQVEGSDFSIGNGSIVIAAITSCTNTSNPTVMMAAGLLARNAVRRGLRPKPWVKTSLSPGSRVVADYFVASGLQEHLDTLGFNVVGFGCMSCMGNSGPLSDPILQAIEGNDLATVAVLSGNRNFDARVHNSVQLNFLASPPLVVAYALAGSIHHDLIAEPLGFDPQGIPVFLRDIWPSQEEVRETIERCIVPKMFTDRYSTILQGSPQWRALKGGTGKLYDWNPASLFIQRPPYFEGMSRNAQPVDDIRSARVLGMFGDMLTTDHISPIGKFSSRTPAGAYLESLGVAQRDFVNYAARRLNHHVMMRGTFANVRLHNEMTPGVEGSATRHLPGGAQMNIFEAAELYRAEGVPLVIVAGKEYGAGSSRDWAAKGTGLLGVRAVIAESLERIHRANLVSMGVLPLQFTGGDSRQRLALDGSETFDIVGLNEIATPRQEIQCVITRATGERLTVTLLARIDSMAEIEYFRHGGILKYVLRSRL